MTLVVDASVIVRNILEEPDRERAERVMTRDDLHAPAQAWLETANALRRRATERRIAAVEPRAYLAALPHLVSLHADAPLNEAAFELAVALDHEIYDCLYLALALELDCRLVTADDRFVAKAGRRHAGRVAALRAF